MANATSLNPQALPTQPDPSLIEVWENAYLDREFTITTRVPEFTSVCPKTGLPDVGTITVHYVPGETCIELKAFKYYMLGFRNHGIFYEVVVNKILDDLVAACQPRYMEIQGDFTPRGGISTMVRAEFTQPGYTVPQHFRFNR